MAITRGNLVFNTVRFIYLREPRAALARALREKHVRALARQHLARLFFSGPFIRPELASE